MNKKVTFDENKNKTIIMHTWSYAYKNARIGSFWIQCVADRKRFQRRIDSLEPILNKVLDSNHRKKIYYKIL